MAVETRQIGLLQRVQNFCRKNNLQITSSDPTTIIHDHVQNMALKNAFQKRKEPEHNYIKVNVRFLGKHITTGWFTPDEIKDLNDIGSEVKLE